MIVIDAQPTLDKRAFWIRKTEANSPRPAQRLLRAGVRKANFYQ